MERTTTEPVAGAPAGGVDRAVVLVHGIGSQDRGTVLAGWGGAITGWLEAAGGVTATVVRTGGDDGPMWADVVIEHTDRSSLRLRLIEALWADVVRPPSFWQLLLWAGGIFPVAPTSTSGSSTPSTSGVSAPVSTMWRRRQPVRSVAPST